MATRRKVFTTFSEDPCRCFPKNRWSDWCEAQDRATSRPANWALGPPNSAKIRSPSRPLQWDCVNFRCWGRDLQGCVLGYFHGGSYCLSLRTRHQGQVDFGYNGVLQRTDISVGKLPCYRTAHDLQGIPLFGIMDSCTG
ncbi:hypothetical protein MGG_16666 [Pyricularia oryzae 70-15]|uniref:Uncharacterized protein n=3 Tax=Pyricularia oryzae TaxID=318829 RepID=G4N2L7_PYRO7|nr:uncharacterized protein MGG_16666 [Pyricularia oryzae 70-15]EHA51726.1 hypothetical protein MGG_16666 [Pyricularia oryzae 70-15]ELQ35278.1 hypothetical protein OOU_Y34scaffold00719g42 [Pyricularia oryzae Y34]KAI7914426.1 hypothetical protein M9X92_009004 [Pyricularia oryzae]KAI7921996.1 hypothetical protein M0657_005880 [Pyricularia oryzae]